MHRSKPGFLLRILWCSQSDKHPKNNLAKFGYILNMKVGKKEKQNHTIFGYLLELIIKNYSSKFGENSSIKDRLVQAIVGGSAFWKEPLVLILKYL